MRFPGWSEASGTAVCGIVGTVVLEGAAPTACLDKARDRLAHRGPDDARSIVSPDSRVGLGFRRLSIIDLSEAAAQPISNEDGSVWTIFNGEIYNYRGLRESLIARGHRFRSHTDSEVIVHLFEEAGERLVDQLTGMFAFATWDAANQRVVLARDRLGIKPLYYAWNGNQLTFASELRALLAWSEIPARVDPIAVADYLAYGYVPHDRCILEGVHKLPAGHLLTLELARGARPVVREYWDVEYTGDVTNEREAVEGLRDRIHTAVGDHLVADVPLGIFLSGGIDSTSVLAHMADAGANPVRAFGIDFDVGPSDELRFAELAADRHGAQLVTRQVGAGDARGSLELISSVYDEPLVDYSTIPTYHVSRLAADHVTVALTGDGGDEIFAGYPRHITQLQTAGKLARSRTARAQASALRSLLPLTRRAPGLARLSGLEQFRWKQPEVGWFRQLGLFDDWEQSQLIGGRHRAELRGYDALWLYRHFLRDELPGVTALRYLDLKTYLVDDILVKVDRASMACSLEVRPPLLDHRVVEYAFMVDDRLMLAGGRGKNLLRQAARGLVPEAILERPKRGFGSPIRPWLRAGLGSEAMAGVDRWSIAEAGLIEPGYVRQFMRRGTYNRWAKLWALMVLEAWHRRWIISDGESPGGS
jgi:asparagine synthase (glutamine-hydrolysing)